MKTNPNAPANVVDGIYGSDAMLSDNTGLTKREHFASMAMQGLLSNPEFSAGNYVATCQLSVSISNEIIYQLNGGMPE